MVERLRKRRLNICMALVAERGLTLFEQGGLRLGLVDTMAAGAADESIAVGGPVKIRMIFRMAGQASCSDLFWSCFGELKDLRRLAAAVNVGLAGPVATLACHALAAVLKCQLGMRIPGEALHLVLMAGGAGLGADVVRRGSGHCGRVLRRGDLLLIFGGSIHPPGLPEAKEHRNQRNTQQRTSHRRVSIKGLTVFMSRRLAYALEQFAQAAISIGLLPMFECDRHHTRPSHHEIHC